MAEKCGYVGSDVEDLFKAHDVVSDTACVSGRGRERACAVDGRPAGCCTAAAAPDGRALDICTSLGLQGQTQLLSLHMHNKPADAPSCRTTMGPYPLMSLCS